MSDGTRPTKQVGQGSLAYRGIKSIAASVLRVPMYPTQIPVGSGELLESFHPAQGWLRLHQFKLVLVLGLVMLGTIVAALALAFNEDAVYLLLILIPVFLLGPLLWIGLVNLRLRYDCTWYVLSERALRVRHGLIVIQETTITYENVQNVSVSQGPLQRICGISDILVETAGGGTSGGKAGASAGSTHGGLIEGVDRAEELRERIMAQVRNSRSAGLGDEHHLDEEAAHEAATARGVEWDQLARVLHEIRDALRPTGTQTPPGM